jgi:hypothetical protein
VVAGSGMGNPNEDRGQRYAKPFCAVGDSGRPDRDLADS